MEQCNLELENEAALVYRAYRERSLATQSALRVTFAASSASRARRRSSSSRRAWARSRPASCAISGSPPRGRRVTLFVVLLDTSSADASFNYSAIATLEDREVESAGLYDLATQARGAVMRVVGSGEIAFQRIAREMMGYYLLGFEPEAGDRDGGSHDIKVAVSRPNATVRARGLLSIPAAPPTPEALLAAALRSPLVDRGLPIRATAYALRDGASGKVRLLIAARVGRASRPVSVGFALSGPGGKVVASRAYQGIAGGDGEWVEFTGEAVGGPRHLQPAPRRGGRGGPARQRRAHGEGRARLGGRARDLGPRARAFVGRGSRPPGRGSRAGGRRPLGLRGSGRPRSGSAWRKRRSPSSWRTRRTALLSCGLR